MQTQHQGMNAFEIAFSTSGTFALIALLIYSLPLRGYEKIAQDRMPPTPQRAELWRDSHKVSHLLVLNPTARTDKKCDSRSHGNFPHDGIRNRVLRETRVIELKDFPTSESLVPEKKKGAPNHETTSTQNRKGEKEHNGD